MTQGNKTWLTVASWLALGTAVFIVLAILAGKANAAENQNPPKSKLGDVVFWCKDRGEVVVNPSKAGYPGGVCFPREIIGYGLINRLNPYDVDRRITSKCSFVLYIPWEYTDMRRVNGAVQFKGFNAFEVSAVMENGDLIVMDSLDVGARDGINERVEFVWGVPCGVNFSTLWISTVPYKETE